MPSALVRMKFSMGNTWSLEGRRKRAPTSKYRSLARIVPTQEEHSSEERWECILQHT